MLDACIMEGRDNQTPNVWYRKDNTLHVDCIGHVALSSRGTRDNRLHILQGLIKGRQVFVLLNLAVE